MAEQRRARLLRTKYFEESDVKRLLSSGRGELSEVRSERWRTMLPDVTIVFLAGESFSELRFLGTGRLLEERITSLPDAGKVKSTYHLGECTWFPEGAQLLEPFIFSLVQISNFSRPWLNLRHRAFFPDIDIETLRTGQIDSPRTVSYGLLRGFPSYWRDLIEARAIYEQNSGLAGESTLHQRIFQLIEEVAVAPIHLAQRVDHGVFALGYGERHLEAFVPASSHTWNLSRSLRASRDLGQLVEQWRAILPLTRQGELQRSWRTHRW